MQIGSGVSQEQTAVGEGWDVGADSVYTSHHKSIFHYKIKKDIPL